SLPAEALDVLRILDVALVEDLDRDAAVELKVTRAKDGRHAAAAHELLELEAIGDQVAGLRGPRHGTSGRPPSRHRATTGKRTRQLRQNRFQHLLPGRERLLELAVRDHERAEDTIAVRVDAGLEEEQAADGRLLRDARRDLRRGLLRLSVLDVLDGE